MVDPLIALGVFAVIVAALVLALYPRYGVIPRLRRVLHLSRRVRMEDALKHCLNEQLEGRLATTSSVAGALEITRYRASDLAAELEHLGFIDVSDEGLRLTEAGRTYATRILRSHRLWERYLADRTAVHAVDWHARAEIAEHRMTEQEANALAARMGHPLYDPHGDPIPTERGDVPPVDGVALTELRRGQRSTIVHIEDEPVESFKRIVAEGFRPRMQLKVLDVTPAGIRVLVEGREHTLEPMVARNITVHLIADQNGHEEEAQTLAEVRPGYEATVIRISSRAQGPQRRRLLDLGIVPGTTISAELESATRDPVAYRVRGAVIALRRAQADTIYVEHIRPVDTEIVEATRAGAL